MKHVNNNHIGEWFELAREEIYRYFIPDLDLDLEKWKLILVRNEIDFLGQIRYGRDVEIRTYILKIGNSSFTVGNEVWQDGVIKAKEYPLLFTMIILKKNPLEFLMTLD